MDRPPENDGQQGPDALPVLFKSRTLHHLDLERAAVRALSRNDPRSAFAFADRRCRILPPAGAKAYLLYAEALDQLGLREAAVSAVRCALELEPENLIAARRILAWCTGAEQLFAAECVAKLDPDPDTIRVAVNLLEAAGRDHFARIVLLEREIVGWVVWHGAETIELSLRSPDQSFSLGLSAEPGHWLATNGRRASNFRLARPTSKTSRRLQISRSDRLLEDVHIPADLTGGADGATRTTPAPPNEGATALTVIVPVYRDFAATKSCLMSVLAAMDAMDECRLIIVDDASPEADIRPLLEGAAERADVTLLTNEQNLGFVGAVNRALDETPNGDVVLLNSDAVVPRLALVRLRQIVRSTTGIGTATPFSNNGEFTSFPCPNTSNPLPDTARIELMDQLASEANAGTVIDIPNGIGFCLYLTRECLDAVGRLSDHFYRGYLEDVDLCLRAREAGFRNVCVPSVFVGHDGSRSFRNEKRALVMRNLRVLEQRYPDYAAECAAFLRADPLRTARAALEWAMIRNDLETRWHIILTGRGAARQITIARCKELTERGQSAIAIEFGSDGRHHVGMLINPANNGPQSLRFNLSTAEGVDAFADFLLNRSVGAIEIIGAEELPQSVRALVESRFAYDVVITSTAFACISSQALVPDRKWIGFVESARRVIARDRRSAEFAERVLHRTAHQEFLPVSRRHGAQTSKASRPVLGVLALRSNAEEFGFIDALGNHLAKIADTARIVVLGTSLDDLELMNRPNMVVTGAFAPDDIDLLISGHEIECLLLDMGSPVFGHPLVAGCEASGVPTAATGLGLTEDRSSEDLSLPAGLARQDAVRAVVEWFTNHHRRTAAA